MSKQVRFLLTTFIMWLVVVGLAQAQGPTLIIDDFNSAAFPNIQANVSVLNRSGVPFRDLTQEEFQIEEDGQLVSLDMLTRRTNQDQAIAIMLVLDLSGSAPLNEVKAAANQLLDSLTNPNDLIGIIGFNEELGDLQEIDPFLEANFTSNVDSIRSTINGWSDGNIRPRSAVYEAIYKAILLTSQQTASRKAVIVMTDGYDNASRSSVVTADGTKATAQSQSVPVFTVGIYNSDPSFLRDEPYLQSLAVQSGARYQGSENAAELGEMFLSIQEQMRQDYQLAYTSNLPRDGAEYLVEIQATTPGGVVSAEGAIVPPPPCPIPEVLSLQRDVNGELQTIDPNATLRGPILLVPEACAQNRIVKAEYFVNGELAQEVLTDNVTDFTHHAWEWNWNTRNLDVGQQQIRVVLYDDTNTPSQPWDMTVQVASYSILDQLRDATGLSSTMLIVIGVVISLVLLAVIFFISRFAGKSRQSTMTSPGGYAPPAPAPAPPPAYGAVGGFPPPPGQPSAAPTNIAGTMLPPQGNIPQTMQMGPDGMMPVGGGGGGGPIGQDADKTMVLGKKPSAIGMLVITNGRNAGQQFNLKDNTSIGRGNKNIIVIDDPAASTDHAKIRLQDKQFTLHDMASTNGTRVNGEDVVRHQLQDGDQIEIGETKFVFKQIDT